jgi:hypothetical protein
MSCEVKAARSLAPNGCVTRTKEWPPNCLTELAGGRQTIAAAGTHTWDFSLNVDGLAGEDLILEGLDANAGNELYVTQVTVNGNPIFPKNVSGSGYNGTQEFPAEAFSREAVYWYGGGPLGTGTPFSAILRAAGAVQRDDVISVTVENKGAGSHTVAASLVMVVDPPAAQG